MEHFTPIHALVGGALIAASIGGVLLGSGRIAGISGVLGGALRLPRGDLAWRLLFLLGLVSGGVLAARWSPSSFETHTPAPLPVLVLAGFLVGIGTRAANGCTSGHGVCGTSRLSPRSLVATLTFVLVGSLTAIAASHVAGLR